MIRWSDLSLSLTRLHCKKDVRLSVQQRIELPERNECISDIQMCEAVVVRERGLTALLQE